MKLYKKHIILIFAALLTISLATMGQTTVVIPDAGFKARLINRYPSIMNSNGELIIARAATVSGLMTCNNCGIKSLEGLQYFVNISEINFPRNSITYIPDISSLQKLTSITINDNLLAYLPDLSKLKRLRNVYAHRNKLKYIPDLSQNDSLQILYIHSNLLESIPDLGNLKRLYVLHLFNNNLNEVPGLDKLTNLQLLRLDYNNLTSLPSMESFTRLYEIQAQNNNLTAMPSFPRPNKLKTVRFESNQLTLLPDLEQFDSIQLFRVHNNNLTFTELSKITKLRNYNTITIITPQAVLKTGRIVSVKEKDQFYLRTYTDTALTGVTYNWYKDSTLVATVTNDRYPFSQATYADSGKYSCQLRYADLSSLVLRTDTFVVSVNPCVEVKNLTSFVTGADCNNSGIVQIKSNPALEQGSYYSIKGLASGKETISSDGRFSDLHESDYILKIISSNGCETAYPTVISVPIKTCSDILLTPNNDGNMDTYFFSNVGSVKIYDKRGHLIKSFQAPAEWDGTSDNGKVPVGYYMADINNGQSKLGLSVIY